MARSYRFFLRHSTLPESSEAFLLSEKNEPEIFYQLTKVLRAREGDAITLLSDRDQPPPVEHVYHLASFDKKNLQLNFSEKITNDRELSFSLELMLCLPNKPEKLELILQKSVELGVTSIRLVEGDFSQMKHQLRLDRLEKIIIEAAEQSERAIIPTVRSEGKLARVLESENASVWVAMERIQTSTLPQLLEKNMPQKEAITLLIGPEGGFSEAEKNLIAVQNLPCFTLGRRILRMETAAIVSVGIVSQYF